MSSDISIIIKSFLLHTVDEHIKLCIISLYLPLSPGGSADGVWPASCLERSPDGQQTARRDHRHVFTDRGRPGGRFHHTAGWMGKHQNIYVPF